jgi:hypothetical protein
MASQQPMETDLDLAVGVFILQSLRMPTPPVSWWSWYVSATICWRSTAHVTLRRTADVPSRDRQHGCAVSGTKSASVSVPAKRSDTRDVRAMAAARP